MNNDTKILSETDELDLFALFDVIWSGIAIILFVTIVSGLGSIYYALSIPNQYKAEVVLAPAQKKSEGVSSVGGEMSGLASLAGISSSSGGNDSQITQEIMKSRDFIERFVSQEKLEVPLLAVTGWDKEKNNLILNPEIYDNEKNVWLSEDGPPIGWKLYLAFRGKLNIVQNKVTGFVTVSFEHFSPESAKNILDAYINEINSHMQLREINQVTRNIEYLQNQIMLTDIAQMQSIFYKLIEAQTRDRMLAAATPDYAFDVINPAMKPELKSKPNRAVICILVTILGAMLSIIFVLIRHFIKNHDQVIK